MKKSLRSLKNSLTDKEKTLKSLWNIYPHLSHLTEVEILIYFEVETIIELKQHLKESTILHLDLEIKNSDQCSCSNSKNQPKDIYVSQEIAQKEADRLSMHNKVKLKVYLCPSRYGWHLSKL